MESRTLEPEPKTFARKDEEGRGVVASQDNAGMPDATEEGEISPVGGKARSISIASNGIKTGDQFAGFMSALIGDIMEGRVTPQVANAAINAGGKLLKVVDMQARYGRSGGATDGKLLELVK